MHGKVDPEEQAFLRDFFEDFICYSRSTRNVQSCSSATPEQSTRLSGVCAVCPVIEFPERVFCFTGASVRARRSDIAGQIVSRRGVFKDSITQDIHYLVVGAGGNPCWAYSCYGRKVEQAVALRRVGHRLTIVHENDFWDAVEDAVIPQ